MLQNKLFILYLLGSFSPSYVCVCACSKNPGNNARQLTMFHHSGKMSPLLSVVKLLFNHIWDVLSNVPSFQSEYGIILRHLLAVRDYRFHIRKRIYSSEFLF